MAQTSTGVISGSVEDESGAVVPGASVTITNVDTGIARSATTDGGGRYHVPALLPGRYEVQVQASGFQTEVHKGIQLVVGSEINVDLSLKVGQVQQTTVVEAQAPLVETTSSSLSGLVDDRTIRDLPLNGRSYEMLISLQSSAPQIRTRGGTPFSGAGAAFSVNGAREVSNLFLMDGTEVVGAGAQASLPGGVLGKNMGVEAVQEFTVLTSNYGAAYGKRSGGQINTATRSGTNQIHGSAFEFLRNDNLDARNYFDYTAKKPEFRRNQFGGAIGGPVRKDRTFYFGTYEGLREDKGKTTAAIVPDLAARQRAVPAVRPWLALFPEPNGIAFGDGGAEYNSAPMRVSRQDFFLVRMDHKISDKDSLFVRYNFSDAVQNDPDSNPVFYSYNKSRDHLLTLEEKRVYATALNQFRFGFTRSRSYSDSLPSIELDSSLRFLPGVPQPGQITFSSSTTGGQITQAGSGTSANRYFVVNQFDTGDQVYLYHGPHSLQFGAKVQRIQFNNDFGNSRRGTFQFADLQNFLNGIATLFRAPAGGAVSGDATKAYRQIYFATYLQDDWKIGNRLTLNLGVRYEVMSVPIEASGNRISNFRVHLVNGIAFLNTQPSIGKPFYQGNHNNIAPRVGLAWDPLGDGKTSVRAGFGVFYDQIQEEFRFFTATNVPFFGLTEVRNPSFPFGLASSAGTVPTPTPDGIDFNLKTPTRLQYNFSIQRQVAANTSVTVGYVGSHSYHLTRQSDANSAVPTFPEPGVKFYPAGSPRKNPALGGARFITSDANSFYQSLQFDVIQRLSSGLRAKFSYTFAKNIDEASALTSQQTLSNPNAPQDPDRIRADRSLSGFHLKHNVATNVTYDLPGQKITGPARYALGGWQLSAIVSLSSGTPFTAQTAFSNSRDLQRTIADRPNLSSGFSNNPIEGVTAGCQGVTAGRKLGTPDLYFDPCAFVLPALGFYGNLARNTIIGPGFVNFDFSLVKMTTITERYKLDFRAEFFNLFNHANFSIPGHDLFQSNRNRILSAGRINATNNDSRQMQFGLKLIF